MDEFIDHIAKTCGLDAGTARKAIGIIINFVVHEGPDADVGKVIDGLPGAKELAAENSGASGGLFGVFNDLTGLGLGMGQVQALTREFISLCRTKIGTETVDKVVNGIPGLSQFI